MRIDLEWFRTFKAVFETGTMSDAAKELNISQPGVSLHLNALEAYIGHPLFKRNTRRMVPNERAKMLYQQVCNSLVKLEEVESNFRKKKTEGRSTLSVGMYPSLFRQCLEKHVPELNFNLIIHVGTTEELIPLLAHGSVDLAVLNQEIPLRNIAYDVLGVTRFVLVAGTKTDVSEFRSLLGHKKKLMLWLESQLWYNTTDRELFNRFWKQNFGREPDFPPNYILPDKLAILNCLSENRGLAVLPEFLCREAFGRGELVRLWDGSRPLENTLYIGYRKNALLTDEILEMIRLMKTEFDGMGQAGESSLS